MENISEIRSEIPDAAVADEQIQDPSLEAEAAPNREPKKLKGVSYGKWGYLFIAPFFIVFLIFQLYPMIYTLILSFTDLAGWKLDFDFIGPENFRVVIPSSSSSCWKVHWSVLDR